MNFTMRKGRSWISFSLFGIVIAFFIYLRQAVCHEKTIRRVGHLKDVLRNFERDGGRPTAYGVQAQFANHFVRLEGKLTGRERQLEG